MAIFFSKVQAADTPPDDLLFPFNRPSAPAVRRFAFAAYKQFRQGIFPAIFSEFGFCPNLFDFLFAGSSCQFLLYLCESRIVYDGGMIVFDILLFTFTIIDLYLFADAIDDKRFIDDRIAFVFLVIEY